MGFFCFLYVLVRCCYPRFRYDYLILCSWISILPMILVFIFITIEFIITRV
jgi:NADH:ubiquinone oxidoreductase subunit H